MKGRSEIRLDRPGVQIDHAAGCRYDEIHGALFRERTSHLEKLHLRDPFQPLPFGVRSQLAIPFHTRRRYQLAKFRDVVIQSQP